MILQSCQEDKMSKDYLIESTTDLTSNKEGLTIVKNFVKEIQLYENTKNSMLNVLATYDSVVIAKEVAKLFNPDNFQCPLPKKLKKKLKENPNWAPSFVTEKINKLPKYALHVDDASLAVLLSTITLKKSNNEKLPIVVLGAPTYSNLNVHNFIDRARSEFSYSLDFSGYLSAALSTSAKGGKNEISQSAKLAMDKSGMLMLARGHVFSPLFVALRPSKFPDYIEQTNFERLSTIYAILNALPQNTETTDEITTPMELDVIWSSVSGQSKFNGEGSLKANAGGGIGIVSASFNSEGGASMSKKASFTEIDSYILDANILTNYDPVKVEEVNNALKMLTSKAVIERPAETINGKINFTIQFPKGFRDLVWGVKENGFSVEDVSIDENNYCSFVVSGSSNSTNDLITLETTFESIDLERKIILP